jgi:hypothetical protein
MARKISKQQFVDLWWDEFCDNGYREGTSGSCCILCGGSGIINTVGKVFNARGEEAGGMANCICPNGRALKRRDEADARREAED